MVTSVTSFTSEDEITQYPTDGAYVHGIFIEGARWDRERHQLATQRKKELISEMPVMQIVPTESSRVTNIGAFKTPVYVTSDRRNAAGVGLVFMADLTTNIHSSI